MSLKTWEAEFYPQTAEAFALMDHCDPQSQREAIQHSIRKWRGLLPQNLMGHGCVLTGKYLEDARDRTKGLAIDGDSCALCRLNHVAASEDPDDHDCWSCPVFLSRDGVPCDDASSNKHEELYWQGLSDPAVMIEGLEKALAWLDAKEAEKADQKHLAQMLEGAGSDEETQAILKAHHGT